MREIITIQLGSISNHVGTHFWNAQDEYLNYPDTEINPDVLYRQGESASGVLTYTPRALIYDLKDGFGSLQKYNRLYDAGEDDNSNVLWDQGVNRIDRGISKPRYQQELDRMDIERDSQMNLDVIDQLEDSIQNWSDYNRIFYHPRTINPIMAHLVDDPVAPFDSYVIGRQAYEQNEKDTESFDENFRFFAEESDSLQGFQIITDIDDGFGGFTEGLLNNIRDEYSKTPIITYGLSDSKAGYRTERHKQKIMLNRAFSTTRLTNLSSIFVPIYTPTIFNVNKCGLSPYLRFNEFSRYHTSAIIASAIESNLLPYRLKSSSVTLADSVSQLNWANSTKLACLSISLPLPLSKNEDFNIVKSAIKSDHSLPLLSLLDRVPIEKTDTYGEIIVSRGLPKYKHNDSEFLEKLYSGFMDSNDPLHSHYTLEASHPLPNSYPRIFTPIVDEEGYIKYTARESYNPVSLPTFTRFEAGSKLSATIDQHLKNLEFINWNDFHEYNQGEYGLTKEDFLETKESLFTISDYFKKDDMEIS